MAQPEYKEDAEPHDEDDPEYQEEMFVIFQKLGWGPEHITDAEWAAKYRDWLEKQ